MNPGDFIKYYADTKCYVFLGTRYVIDTNSLKIYKINQVNN